MYVNSTERLYANLLGKLLKQTHQVKANMLKIYKATIVYMIVRPLLSVEHRKTVSSLANCTQISEIRRTDMPRFCGFLGINIQYI